MAQGIAEAKQAIRTRIWDLLEREHVTEPGVHGHIPAFTGAKAAAARLADLPAWQAARVIKAVPDTAQQPVRERALRDGKLLYIAVPRLAADLPFRVLDPRRLRVSPAEAASTDGAARLGPLISTADMQPINMVVCGSVAVSRNGARLGKGAGYSDIEVALLHEAGLITPATVIATTVHDLQVITDPIPEAEHDFSVDLIITPTQTILCSPPRRPGRLYWEHLSAEQIAAIPVLAAKLGRRRDAIPDTGRLDPRFCK
jgi:5-formyltetrahydrofolate cyclo-ligase